MRRAPHRWFRRGLITLGVLLALVIVLDQLFPPPIERGRIVSTLVTDRDGRPLRAFPVDDGRWRLAASLDDIDPRFIEALLIIEDKRFFDHWGVDPLAASRAVGQAIRQGQITSGASTITMQTARLLEPRPRTLGSKFIECLRAFQLERRLSKDEILELYLTLAPYGGNIEGVRSASWAWFGRDPQQLTADQIALLIALPQAPEARRPDRREAAATAARARILGRLADAGFVTASRAADAALETLPTERRAFPSHGWHAAARLHRASEGTPARIRSTLDASLQEEAERYVRSLIAKSPDPEVQVAALIVDIETRAVRAAVGSASRARPGGWIDLTNRPRSPGSTLKPFIYGMAFDDGSAAPGTVINDLPSRFAGYRPENFDRTFRGQVTIADALQHSLNVPAVRVLDQVGANRFLAALSLSGATPVLPDSTTVDVGLAVALGGLGLTVEDLAVLYTALGDDGQIAPLRWDDDTPVPVAPAPQLLSAESAGEVLTILEGAPPPSGRLPAALAHNVPAIAFKTGTSYGFRDAWAAGVSSGHAVVVWVGRADGTPRPGETGRKTALPLLFELFDAVHQSQTGQNARPLSDARPASAPSVPTPMAQFAPASSPPEILFPPDGAEIWAENNERSFSLTARGQGRLTWYADGEPIPLDPGGSTRWTPQQSGFFRLVVVDPQGRSAVSRVRVQIPAGY